MKEIKFRGLNYRNEWVFGLPFNLKETDTLFIINNCSTLYGKEDDTVFTGKIIKSETVSQYTGLKDKNGIEIYDGDLLSNPKKEIGKVIWDNSGFHLECKRKNNSYFFIPLDKGFLANKEIIGNIHETPSLYP